MNKAQSNTATPTGTTNRMPDGVPYIIGNEAAERYSFYGMKAILVVFMTKFLHDSTGELDTMSDTTATFWFHTFVWLTYLTPVLGAFISDIFWGKYRTIIRISFIYILGHAVLAFFETKFGLFLGCGLIAFGAGGIKPCVSAHVGDQFGSKQSHLFEKIFMYFYFAINFGSFIAYLSAEWLLTEISPTVAFGIPGILMAVATFIFWLGRKKFISIKPAGWQLYKEEVFSAKGWSRIKKLIPLYLFLAIFWSLFDQTGSAWVLQAQSDLMSKHVDLGFIDFNFYPSQIGFMNPILILVFIPLFTFLIYPFLRARINLTYSTKITIGMFITVFSFALLAWVQSRMDAGITMSIGWQILAYIILTAAEIMVSITALEFSYTQAPNSMKSFIMSFYLLSVAIGNIFTSIVAAFIEKDDGTVILSGASYFWFFTAIMLLSAIGYFFYGRTYREEAFIQSKENVEEFI